MHAGSQPENSTLSERCRSCGVRHLSFCGVLDCGELARMDAITIGQDFKAQESIAYEGDEASEVFNITSGVVRLTKLLSDGRRAVTGFLYPGDFLGLAFKDSYINSAEAVTDVEACRMSRQELEGLFHEMPQLEDRLLNMMSNEIVASQDQMLLLGRKSPQEKLATFLLDQKKKGRGLPGEENRFLLPMARVDIADYLGLTVETVSRTFTRFSKDGLIVLNGAADISILDEQQLSDLAGEYDEH